MFMRGVWAFAVLIIAMWLVQAIREPRFHGLLLTIGALGILAMAVVFVLLTGGDSASGKSENRSSEPSVGTAPGRLGAGPGPSR